ncbi:hypothetical protein [Algoriphagus sp.]|uniref:hypothetical protein n=1 Tax=Algoriphagus sp. TaxID=1872435 RepID=UPI003F6EF55E
MGKTILVFLSLFIYSISALAQNSESESYVILQSGTKVPGVIKSEFDVDSYAKVIFVSNTGEETVYHPGDIQAFGLQNGRLFKSQNIPTQDHPVFVQVLVSGDIDLYKWDKKFFINQEDTVVELKINHSTKTENGKLVNVSSNQYIGVLTLAMNDECGISLKKEIEKARLTDRSLIQLFSDYYSCKNIPHEVHASKMPFSSLSLRMQGSISLIGLVEYKSNKDITYSLDKNSSPYVEIGVRFKEFRNAPRLLVDLGVGYIAESNVVNVEGNLISFMLSGSERYKSSSFLVPIHLSYIAFKKGRNEIYTGTGLTFWVTSFKPETGELIIDNGEPNPNVINSIFADRKEMSISPNLKVGYRNSLSEKTRLFVELKGDLLLKNMNFYPLTYYTTYNYLVGTLSVGIEI